MFGFSFSWKRATGVTKAKRAIAKATGIPTSRSGRKAKVSRIVASPITSILFPKKKRKSKKWF